MVPGSNPGHWRRLLFGALALWIYSGQRKWVGLPALAAIHNVWLGLKILASVLCWWIHEVSVPKLWVKTIPDELNRMPVDPCSFWHAIPCLGNEQNSGDQLKSSSAIRRVASSMWIKVSLPICSRWWGPQGTMTNDLFWIFRLMSQSWSWFLSDY